MTLSLADKVISALTSRRASLAAVVAVLYLGLWGVTQLVGVPRVRAAVAAKHLPPPEQIWRPGQYRSCHAKAVAPFLVKATYYWHLEDLLGEIGEGFYVWLGPIVVEGWARPTLME
jgi:hypothetical protein